MTFRRRSIASNLWSLGIFVVLIGAVNLIISALLITLNRIFGITWAVILLVAATITILLSARLWQKGLFLSPWSLQLRTLYRKYSHFGVVPLLSLFKSRRRRLVEFLKGVFVLILVLIIGICLGYLHSSNSEDFPFDISGSILGTTWQVHTVLIGFSFVALTFVWEEIYDNSLSNELSRLFVEDIGSIRTVTFVFGSNLVIGIVVFIHSSAQTVGYLPAYTTAILFIASIANVASRFLEALDLLFYTDLNEDVKYFAKKDLEKEVISTSSTPNKILADSVTGFNQVPVPLTNFGLERITFSSRDIGKKGTITDMNLRKMRMISEIVQQEDRANIDQSPTVDSTLAEDTTVLSIEGEISEESQEQIERCLRRGLRTRGGN